MFRRGKRANSLIGNNIPVVGSQLVRGSATFAAALVGLTALATEPGQTALELFEKEIRPVLVDHCQRCHGPQKQQGNLRLDSPAGWSTGGDSGPAIIAGDPESLLLQAIRYEGDYEMPPKGKLPEKTIEAFHRWVAQGAVDPRADPAAPGPPSSPSVPQGRSFWSFQPVVDPPIPDVVDSRWPAGAIDRFILAALEQNGLKPSPDAGRPTLLRRLYYDLVGLPPTPDQIESFLADSSSDAYAKLVDRLLDSPQFGQRWGRHWLDVVRYAESSGGGRTLLFPEAWRYRDYVIDSFNRDLPFSDFVVQQIAGDLLPAADWQQRRRNLIATAFLLLGPTNYELQDKDVLEMDVVDEQLDTLGKAFLGMTIGCARCHDHKFDPIPAHDYYALAGILKSSRSLKHANVSEWNTVELPMSPQQESRAKAIGSQLVMAKAAVKEARRRWIDAGGQPAAKPAAKSIDPESIAGIVVDNPQAEQSGQWTESTSNAFYVGKHYLFDASEAKPEGRVVFRPQLPAAGRYEVRVCYSPGNNRATAVPVQIRHAGGMATVVVNQRRSPPIDGKYVSLGTFDFDPAGDPMVAVVCRGTDDGVVIADAAIFIPQGDQPAAVGEVASDADQIKSLKQQLDRLTRRAEQLEQSLPKPPLAMAMADQDNPGDIHLAIRGAVHQQGALVPRGVMQVATWDRFPAIPADQSGRKQLADWIVDPQHPLTSRVIANRVWYWLFGRGIVQTVDNFGSMGEAPSHPELLDHLASSLVRDGWSIKNLIRRIVNSNTYRQGSDIRTEAATIDPGNRLLWRMNRKRLRAEDIRDSLLLIAGRLDARHGGSNIKTGTKSEYGYQFTSLRRSAYLPVFRNTLPEIFEVFDFADPNIQRGRRSSSTVSSQALLMMNHPLVIEQAASAAERLVSLGDWNDSRRIDYAFRQVLGRPATITEAEIALDLVGDSDNNGIDGWAALYQVLFQCIDFRYLN